MVLTNEKGTGLRFLNHGEWPKLFSSDLVKEYLGQPQVRVLLSLASIGPNEIVLISGKRWGFLALQLAKGYPMLEVHTFQNDQGSLAFMETVREQKNMPNLHTGRLAIDRIAEEKFDTIFVNSLTSHDIELLLDFWKRLKVGGTAILGFPNLDLCNRTALSEFGIKGMRTFYLSIDSHDQWHLTNRINRHLTILKNGVGKVFGYPRDSSFTRISSVIIVGERER